MAKVTPAYPPAAGIEETLGARVGDRVLAEIADRLHSVFATPDPAECARLVTGILAETGVRPALEADAGRLYPPGLSRTTGTRYSPPSAAAARPGTPCHEERPCASGWGGSRGLPGRRKKHRPAVDNLRKPGVTRRDSMALVQRVSQQRRGETAEDARRGAFQAGRQA